MVPVPAPVPVPVPVPPVPMPVPVGMDPGSRFYRTAAAKMARRSLTRVRSALTLCVTVSLLKVYKLRGGTVWHSAPRVYSPQLWFAPGVGSVCRIREVYSITIYNEPITTPPRRRYRTDTLSLI